MRCVATATAEEEEALVDPAEEATEVLVSTVVETGARGAAEEVVVVMREAEEEKRSGDVDIALITRLLADLPTPFTAADESQRCDGFQFLAPQRRQSPGPGLGTPPSLAARQESVLCVVDRWKEQNNPFFSLVLDEEEGFDAYFEAAAPLGNDDDDGSSETFDFFVPRDSL